MRESACECNPQVATVLLSGAETAAVSSAPNACLPYSPKPFLVNTGAAVVIGTGNPSNRALIFFRFRIDAAAAREYYKM